MNEVKRRAPVRSDPAPKPRAAHAAAPARPVLASKKNVTIARGKKPQAAQREPLKKRRKQQRKALFIFFAILVVVLIAVALYLTWLPVMRISDVTAEGPHAEEARSLARESMYGTHLFIVPRNSLFFIPEKDIRTAVLGTFPDIEAVSLSAKGLTTLSLRTTPRAEVFRWCGTDVESSDGTCYQANAEGLIFAPLSPELSVATGTLKVYGPLDAEAGDSPVRSRVSVAHRLPDVLRMIRAIEALGSDVTTLAIRDDEADLYLASGTRVTYVLGHEEQAAGLAASVFPQLSLNDGSIAYVDLRFEGKVYYRRKGE